MSAGAPVDLGGAGLFVAPGQEVEFGYRNRRGEGVRRRVRPIALWFGATRWHPEPQWLLRAVDLERGVPRDFALADIVPDAGTADGDAGSGRGS